MSDCVGDLSLKYFEKYRKCIVIKECPVCSDLHHGFRFAFEHQQDKLSQAQTEIAELEDQLRTMEQRIRDNIPKVLQEENDQLRVLAESMYSWTLINYPEEYKEYIDDVENLDKIVKVLDD